MSQLPSFWCLYLSCCRWLLLFFHRHHSGWRMFPGQPQYHPTAQLHHGFLRSRRWLCYSICIGVVVWSFIFCWTCRFMIGAWHCKFWKVYLPQINYGGKLTCFGCSPRIGYHWFVCLMGLQFLCWRVPAAVSQQLCSKITSFQPSDGVGEITFG